MITSVLPRKQLPLGQLLAALALAVTLAAGPISAFGQSTIVADRPGFGDGSATVSAGTVQAELGAAAANDDFGANGEIGQLLLRYGVTDAFEIRGGVGSLALNGPDTEYTGTSVGAKLRLYRGGASALTVVSAWDLPTGSGNFEAESVAQTLKLAYDGSLGEGLGVTLNAGASVPYAEGAELTYLFIPTLSFGLAENVGGYVGYAGYYASALNANYVEAGLTLLSDPDTQLDLNTGFQLDQYQDAFFVGVGLAHRF